MCVRTRSSRACRDWAAAPTSVGDLGAERARRARRRAACSGRRSRASWRGSGASSNAGSDDALDAPAAPGRVSSDVTPDDYRTRVAVQVLVFGGGRVPAFGVLVVHSALAALGLAGRAAWCSGRRRSRGRLDRAIEDRRERIRLELYTVNQLLAMHVRTGAGPVQATQRIVDRGDGRGGRRAARRCCAACAAASPNRRRSGALPSSRPSRRRPAPTSCSRPAPSAASTSPTACARSARTCATRGARRSARPATKRRAAMLVPTIAVLAPVMLLFIAAPLPSIVFGSR